MESETVERFTDKQVLPIVPILPTILPMRTTSLRLLTLIHVLLSLFGAGLCAFRGLEAGGAFVLCCSVLCVMIIKLDHIISIDASGDAPDLPADLNRVNGVLNTVYRRVATLANLMDTAAGRSEQVPLQLAHVLRAIDSSDPGIDTTIDHLRDLILMRGKVVSRAPSGNTGT